MRFHTSLTSISLFVAAYEERSISAAAEREHATQSGVSQHIRKLESSLGVELFLREASGVVPTPAGETYYRACVELLRGFECATRNAQHYGDALGGEVSIGLMATVTRSALAPALSRFTQEHPNVRVRVIEAPSRLLAQQVHAGDMDFAIVPTLLEHPGLRRTFFLRTPEVLVSSPVCGQMHLQALRLATIENLKLILPSSRNIRRQAFERYFADAGVRLARELELDVIFTVLDMVAKTEWRTLLPAVMMLEEIRGGRLTINTVVDPALWLDFSCIEPMRRPMSGAAQVFFRTLQDEASELNRLAIAHLHAPPDSQVPGISISAGSLKKK